MQAEKAQVSLYIRAKFAERTHEYVAYNVQSILTYIDL